MRAWALALLVAVFVLGGAAGWAARGWNGRPCEPRLRDTGAMVQFLTKELDLTAVQQDSVRGIFRRHRAEMQALWQAMHPRVDSLRAVMQAEIDAQLTPDQQRRHRELVARLARERAARDSSSAERK